MNDAMIDLMKKREYQAGTPREMMTAANEIERDSYDVVDRESKAACFLASHLWRMCAAICDRLDKIHTESK